MPQDCLRFRPPLRRRENLAWSFQLNLVCPWRIGEKSGPEFFESYIQPRAAIFDVVPSAHPPPHARFAHQLKMSRCQQVARPIALCLRPRCSTQIAGPSIATAKARFFFNSASLRDVEPTTTTASASAADTQATADLVHADSKPDVTIDLEAKAAAKRELKARWMDPNTTTLPWAEKKLLKKGINPIGSRRRRAAVRQTLNIPFEQLPYHCFQEARKLLAEDRAQKLDDIKKAYLRLKTVEAQPATKYRGGEDHKFKKLRSLRGHLEYLKVQADMNDPAVKRKFEDGLGKFNLITAFLGSTPLLTQAWQN